jgi:uncharacterized protein YbjT (DUF2867 family)
LRQRGLPVRAIVRDDSSDKARALADIGCALTVADIRDVTALTAALTGAEAALVLCPIARSSGDTIAESAAITEALGTALARARPSSVVALSDYGAHHPTGTGVAAIFHRLEERLRALGIPATFLRSAEHTENWTRIVRAAAETGIFHTCHQPATRPIPTIWSADLAIIAADLLTAPPAPSNAPRIVHAEGPRRYTPAEMATTAEAIAARPIQVNEPSPDQWLPALLAAGLGQTHARLVTEMYAAHNAGNIEFEPGGEIRHGTTTLARAYAALLGHSLVAAPRVRGCFS